MTERNVVPLRSPRTKYLSYNSDIGQWRNSNSFAKTAVFLNDQLPVFDNDLSDIARPEDDPEYYGFECKFDAIAPTLTDFNTDDFCNCTVWLCRNVANLRDHLIHPNRWTLCLLNHIKGQIGSSWSESYFCQYPNTRRFSTFWRQFLHRFTLIYPSKQAKERLISLQIHSIPHFIIEIEKIRSAVGRIEEVEEMVREALIEQLPIHFKDQLTTWRLKKDPIDSLIKEIEQMHIIFQHDQALLSSTYQYLDKY